MPKFAVVSPSDIAGKKKEAWENFRNGGYISIGYVVDEDLSGKSMDEIAEIVRLKEAKYGEDIVRKRIREYERFFSLDIGDYVAANNTNDGLFGIGKITSSYFFKKHGHNTGSTNPKEFYCHHRAVDWLVTSYMRRKDIVNSKEKSWAPYGIISNVILEVPQYINRILD